MKNSSRIDSGQSFSELSRELHDQFKEQGAHAGIRFDGKGLYVKNNDKFWDHYVGTKRQLAIRHDKFRNAIQQLSHSIDREYAGLTVKGKKLSQYVLGDFMNREDYNRLSEKDLTALEEKIQEGLKEAFGAAVDRHDVATVELIDYHDAFVKSASTSFGDVEAAYRSGRWRDYAEGYASLRNAIATDLARLENPAVDHGAEGSGNVIDAQYLEKAENIIASLDLRNAGLTKASIEKTLNHMAADPDNDRVGGNRKVIEFRAVNELFHQVNVCEAVDVNAKRITALINAIEEDHAKRLTLGTLSAQELKEVQPLIDESKTLIAFLKQEKWGLARDHGGFSVDLAEKMKTHVEKINDYYCNESKIEYANKLRNSFILSSLTSVSPSVTRLRELAAATLSLARLLPDRGNRDDPRLQNFDMPLGVAQDERLDSHEVRTAMSETSDFVDQFGKQTKVYQDLVAISGEKNTRFGDPLERYQDCLAMLRGIYESYLENASDPEALEGLRRAMDDALAAQNHIAPLMAKAEGLAPASQIGAVHSNTAVLEEQASRLNKLSYAIDIAVNDFNYRLQIADAAGRQRLESDPDDDIWDDPSKFKKSGQVLMDGAWTDDGNDGGLRPGLSPNLAAPAPDELPYDDNYDDEDDEDLYYDVDGPKEDTRNPSALQSEKEFGEKEYKFSEGDPDVRQSDVELARADKRPPELDPPIPWAGGDSVKE